MTFKVDYTGSRAFASCIPTNLAELKLKAQKKDGSLPLIID